MGEKKERNTNLELYRIIVMLAIVAHHSVVNSGLLDVIGENPMDSRSLFAFLFGAWGKTGINCFVLISGYFMCKSEITLKKLLKLLGEVYFYSITINAVFLVTGYVQPSFKLLFFILLPIQGFSGNFVSCFIVYYLAIPFLNILVRNMSKREHQLLLLLVLSVYTLIGSLPSVGVRIEYITWFCILHMVSSYIRFYEFPVKITHVQWGWLSLLSFFLACVSVIGLIWLGEADRWDFLLSDTNKFFAFSTGLSSFMWFKDLEIPHSKFVNRIAASAFGVLLIHANSDVMRQWLWNDVFDMTGMYYMDGFVLYCILSVLVIYIVCSIIDQFRIILLEKPLFNLVDKRLGK